LRSGDDYLIDGSKIFISNGYLAGLIALVVKTQPGEGAKGTSIIMVETQGLAGFRVGRILDKMGMKSQDTSELFFENVRVPASNLLGGTEGRGFYQLMGDLPYERALIAVTGAAAMEGALQATIAYVKERQAFGRSIAEFQNTRFTLAELATKTHLARLFADECIAKIVTGTLDTVTASMAKYWVSEVQQQVIDECVQLHGGYGYMNEYLVCRMFTDARVQRIYGGTNEIMKELISRSL
jgi:acyl-CoA dehydrogenase